MAEKTGRDPKPAAGATGQAHSVAGSPLDRLDTCPVKADVEQVATTGQDFVKALRRLKRDLNACRSCPLAEDCPVLSSFNSQVVTAITEVNIEWGML
jgi:hypothetical protein